MKNRTAALHILGAGAIGHLLACHQELVNRPTILIERTHKPRPDLHFVELDGKISKLNLHYSISDHLGSIETLVVAVKTYQLAEALHSVSMLLHANSQVLILCNGMGNLETAMSVLTQVKTENIFIGINTHGCYIESLADKILVRHSGHGTITYGPNYLHTESMKTHDGFQFSEKLNSNFKTSVESDLWLKLAINAVVNPLTAIHQCRNGQLLENIELKQTTEKLIKEIAELYTLLELGLTKAIIQSSVFDVIKATANNYSSMYMDIKNKKLTEIDAISGYLLHYANEIGFLMQQQQYLYNMIKNIEQGHKFDNSPVR